MVKKITKIRSEKLKKRQLSLEMLKTFEIVFKKLKNSKIVIRKVQKSRKLSLEKFKNCLEIAQNLFFIMRILKLFALIYQISTENSKKSD